MHSTFTSLLIDNIRDFWRQPKGALVVIFSTLLYIIIVDNITLWNNIWQRELGHTFQALFLILTIATIIFSLLFLLIVVLSHRLTIKFALAILLYMGAVVGYYNAFGVIFDETMIRNIALSDMREAKELMSSDYLMHMAVYFLLPTVFLFLIPLKKESLKYFFASRALTGLASLALTFALIFSDFQSFSFFMRENNDLKVYINPIYPIMSVKKYVKQEIRNKQTFVTLGDDAIQSKTSKRRTVGIFIVGETARADHFSLNKYARDTNPNLIKQNVISFEQAESCGTSTAYSVPCMFSFIGQDHYNPNLASNQSNVLDVLEKAGVKTLWRDNNSTCKGVCERIETENFRDDPDKNSPFFHIDQYYDEILLSALEERIQASSNDLFIVLHPLGSHGPSYSRRYPASFDKFTPSCQSDAPQTCSHDEVVNAYDNTILYTDFIVSKVIDVLNANSKDNDTFLIYASDHGESLGENGMYLHGMPKMFAPKEQTHIPFIVWLSDEVKSKLKLTTAQLDDCKGSAISHDNISHSLLSLFDVDSSLYQQNLDLFQGPCSRSSVAHAE